ncbi:class I SAM-dependent methyltransferase [Paracidovorax sp. MALMAid1276]|uniref:class I SAM-dependent methyltransferase n=1 Tax=Paracidovorax sp. MALMAid1276 TaxID=3411631 RepID=UPI003B9B3E11
MTLPTASPFSDPTAVARYAEGPRRNVPGYDSLLRMSRILLAEQCPPTAACWWWAQAAGGSLSGLERRIAKVGPSEDSFCRICSPIARLWGKKSVKNGPLRPACSRRSKPDRLLKLEDMALAHPRWRFDGVDPSQPMLDLAAQRLQSAGVPGDRVALHHGYVQSAPAGPFDGATCLLTFHFVPREERVPMAAEIRRRLKPGAPLVVAHLSVADGSDPGSEGGAGERDLWLSRYAAFQVASGVPPEHAARARDKVAAELAVLTPQEDVAILREAGFSDVQMFYVGFAFRGWLARA